MAKESVILLFQQDLEKRRLIFWEAKHIFSISEL